MVPGLAIEEFSTPPSSPVLATRTRRKAAAIPTTNSVDYKPTTRDSSNNLQDIQLSELLLTTILHRKIMVTIEIITCTHTIK